MNFDSTITHSSDAGNVLAGAFDVAGGFLGGSKDFLRFFGRASHYFPLFMGSVLEARAVSAFRRIRRFQAGAYIRKVLCRRAYTIRGYEERKVGPIDSVSKDP